MRLCAALCPRTVPLGMRRVCRRVNPPHHTISHLSGANLTMLQPRYTSVSSVERVRERGKREAHGPAAAERCGARVRVREGRWIERGGTSQA